MRDMSGYVLEFCRRRVASDEERRLARESVNGHVGTCPGCGVRFAIPSQVARIAEIGVCVTCHLWERGMHDESMWITLPDGSREPCFTWVEHRRLPTVEEAMQSNAMQSNASPDAKVLRDEVIRLRKLLEGSGK